MHSISVKGIFLLLGAIKALAGGAQSVSEAASKKDTTAKALNEVVVTGQYVPQSLKQSVYKVRVIGEKRIKQRAATDVLSVLNTEAGIRFSTDNTLGETDINLMGMNGLNVKILLDGIPLVDRNSTRQSLSQIDINTVERIEMVEGPMSVSYGTDALAGVINIITKKAKSNTLSVTARLQEETTGGGYSPLANDGVHIQNVGASWGDKQWSATGSFTRNAFGGWTGAAAYRAQEAKPKDQYLTSGTVGYRTSGTQTTYRLDYTNEDIYAAGALNPNNYRAKDQHYYTDRFTHSLQNEWRASAALRINTALSYQDYKRRTETYTMDYAAGTKTFSTDPGEQDVNTFKTFFARSTAQWQLSNRIWLQPGVEIKSDKTTGQRILLGSSAITDYSVFASAEIKAITGLNLRPGLRFSKNSTYDAPPVMPSLNAKWDISKNIGLRLAYASGFRAPILRELYFDYFDANHSIQGNPNLKAETSNSYQASVTYSFPQKSEVAMTTSVSGFYNRFKNRINMAAGANNIFTYFNLDKYKTAGGSLENNLVWRNLNAAINFLYIGRYNSYSEDKTLGNLPQFTWSPEVTGNLSWALPKLKGTVGLFYKYTGSLPSYASEVNQTTGQTQIFLTRVSGYHWTDVTASKELLKYFTLQAGIKNLFDVVRISNTAESTGAHSTGGPILTGYGRSGFVALLFQWNKKSFSTNR